MKVLIINTVRFRLNGITSVIMNYYRQMDKEGIQIDFAVVNEICDEYRAELEGNRSRIFNIGPKKNVFKYTANLNGLIKKEHYNVVHIHGNSSTMALEAFVARRNHVKKIIVHAHNTECKYPVINSVLRPIMKFLATDFLACSNVAGNWLYKNDNYIVLNNAIDVDRFHFNSCTRDNVRKEFGIVGDEFVIGHIGNFAEQKNHEFLLDIFEEYHKLNSKSKLLLVGDGELKGKIYEKVIDKDLINFVIFAGCWNDIERMYCGMDVFVFPSKWEGLGLVLIEAQANGLPCYASEAAPDATKVSDNIEYISLEQSPEYWAREIMKCSAIMDRKGNSTLSCKTIEKQGYDISCECEKLRQIYMEIKG